MIVLKANTGGGIPEVICKWVGVVTGGITCIEKAKDQRF